MVEQMEAVHVFCSYAHEDRHLLELLRKHLSIPIRQGQMTFWYDREILPGEEWKRIIDERLNEADIILLFVSPNFIASDYCWGQEMHRALERQRAGDTHIIPILLRPTPGWETTPLGNLQALPKDTKPITLWDDHEQALENTANSILQYIQQAQREDRYPITEFVLKFLLPIYVVEGSSHQSDQWSRKFSRKEPDRSDPEEDKIVYDNTAHWLKDVSNTIGATLEEILEDEHQKEWRLAYQQHYGYITVPVNYLHRSLKSIPGRFRYARYIPMSLVTSHLGLLNLLVNAAQVPYTHFQWTLVSDLNIAAIAEQVHIQTGRRPSFVSSAESHIEYTIYTHQGNPIKIALSSSQFAQPAKICLIYVSSSEEEGFVRAHELLSLRRILSILRGELSYKRIIQLIDDACASIPPHESGYLATKSVVQKNPQKNADS